MENTVKFEMIRYNNMNYVSLKDFRLYLYQIIINLSRTDSESEAVDFCQFLIGKIASDIEKLEYKEE